MGTSLRQQRHHGLKPLLLFMMIGVATIDWLGMVDTTTLLSFHTFVSRMRRMPSMTRQKQYQHRSHWRTCNMVKNREENDCHYNSVSEQIYGQNPRRTMAYTQCYNNIDPMNKMITNRRRSTRNEDDIPNDASNASLSLQNVKLNRHRNPSLSSQLPIDTTTTVPPPLRIAIVGGGLAGLATAYHLLHKKSIYLTTSNDENALSKNEIDPSLSSSSQQQPESRSCLYHDRPFQITIFDPYPVGMGGASSVAGGYVMSLQ
jgi:hypothetical protein